MSGAILLCACGVLARSGKAQSPGPVVRVASAIAYDHAGNLYIADAASHQVLEATLGGSLRVFAGSGVQGFSGDGGLAVAAELNSPQGIALGPDDTVYVADTKNQRIRAIDASGQIRTVAGTGATSFGGDGGPAQIATLRNPTALAVDSAGVLYLCDTGNQRVRKIEGGTISTVAGSGTEGYAGEGGPATEAALAMPQGVAVDGQGDVYIADTRNQRVRVVSPSGVISTFAGSGQRGFGGDGGRAAQALLSEPRGLAFGGDGALLIADSGNQRLRAVDSGGVIRSLIGTGVEGSSQDGATALGASLRSPRAVALSGLGMPVIADTLNGTARILVGTPGLFVPAAMASDRNRSTVQVSPGASMTYGNAAVGVLVSGAVGVPQGKLAVSESGVALGTGALSAAATTLTLAVLPAGSHQLLLQYEGDGLNPSTFAQAEAEVAPAPVSVVANPVTLAYGGSLPAFSGTVLGVLPADRDEVIPTWDTGSSTELAVGTHTLLVKLSGAKAANYSVGSAPATATVSVVRAATGIAVQSPSQAFAGLPVPVNVIVSSAGKGQLTGTVQFLDGGTVIASVPVSGGSASTVYPSATVGVRQLGAVFSGDGNFLPSSSSLVAMPVLALPDFNLALAGGSTAQVTPGGTAKYMLAVASNPSPFTGAVSLSATGLPAGASVSFSPPQVVPGTETATVTVAVQTVATTAYAGQAPGRPVHMCLLLTALLICFRRSRRKALPLLCSGCLMWGLSGCGARTVGQADADSFSKTYALQVTGTATNLAGAIVVHSVPLSLTIQQ